MMLRFTCVRVTNHKPENPRSWQDKQWDKICQDLVEIDGRTPTHYCSANSKLSRIDRMFVGSSNWFAKMITLRSSPHIDAMKIHQMDISDHAPVVVMGKLAQQLPADDRPIPLFISQDPKFPMFVRDREQI